jgi:hypothetical protein
MNVRPVGWCIVTEPVPTRAIWPSMIDCVTPRQLLVIGEGVRSNTFARGREIRSGHVPVELVECRCLREDVDGLLEGRAQKRGLLGAGETVAGDRGHPAVPHDCGTEELKVAEIDVVPVDHEHRRHLVEEYGGARFDTECVGHLVDIVTERPVRVHTANPHQLRQVGSGRHNNILTLVTHTSINTESWRPAPLDLGRRYPGHTTHVHPQDCCTELAHGAAAERVHLVRIGGADLVRLGRTLRVVKIDVDPPLSLVGA